MTTKICYQFNKKRLKLEKKKLTVIEFSNLIKIRIEIKITMVIKINDLK